MRTTISVCALCLSILASFTPAQAQEVTTDPVGFYKITCQSNADTLVGIPFTRTPEYEGLVLSASANTITISNSPGWVPGQFIYSAGTQSNHYYAFIASGTNEGAYYPITNNTSSALNVELVPETLGGVAPGDRIKVIPYWTLGTAFPDGNGITPSASAGTRLTELLVPDLEDTGINPGSSAVYYFFTNASTRVWRKVSGGTTSRNDEILVPDSYLIIRHNTGSLTEVLSVGNVVMKKQRTPVAWNANGGTLRDNPIFLVRPASVSLNDSGLYQSGAFRASPSAGSRTDELLAISPTELGYNKGAASIYYYFTNATTSAWRMVGGGTADRGTNLVFQPGYGVIVRKGTNTSASSTIWVNSANY